MSGPFTKLHHLCVVVADIDRAQRFYESVGIGPWIDYPPLAGGHGVRRAGPVDVHPGDVEPRVRGRRDDGHQVAVLGLGDLALGLLPRVTGGHEDDLVEVEPRLHL